MNSVTDYIDTIAFFAFSMYYCSFLYVLTNVTHVTTHVTVCVIWHAEIKGYTYLHVLTLSDLMIRSSNPQDRSGWVYTTLQPKFSRSSVSLKRKPDIQLSTLQAA